MVPDIAQCSKEIQIILQPYLQSISCLSLNPICVIEDNEHFPNLSFKHDSQNIFIIEDGQHIIEILDLKPLAIWRKNNLLKDVQEACEANLVLTFQTGKTNLYLTARHIIYIESYLHYLMIHTTSTTFKVREKISLVSAQLKAHGFIQIHRSYVINRHYLVAHTDTHCLLSDQTALPIGKKYKHQLF